MPIQQELELITQSLASKLSKEQVIVFQQHLERLASLQIEQKSLKKGDIIPAHIDLPNATNKTISIDSLLQTGRVLLTFYRGSWCPYCNLYLRSLQNLLPQFKQNGINLVAISPQTPDNSLDITEKNALSFEVLSDIDNKISKQFGLVFQVEEAFIELQKSIGVDLKIFNGNSNYELPTPATYLVNQNGRIEYSFVESDWTKRPEPTDLLQAIQALKLTPVS